MLSVRRPSAESSTTARSMRTDTTWRYSVFGPERLGRGPMLFTGPDGIRDHQVAVDEEHRYVGEGTMSPEGTSEVDYLWRAPRCIPFPRPKSKTVGEIGWGIPEYVDWTTLLKGSPIREGEFVQTVADRHKHLYQNAWYPGPLQKPSMESRSAVMLKVFPQTNKSAAFDRYGRRLPAATKTVDYARNSTNSDYSSSRNTSRASSATSGRNLYAHYSDSFSRPKSAYPSY